MRGHYCRDRDFAPLAHGRVVRITVGEERAEDLRRAIEPGGHDLDNRACDLLAHRAHQTRGHGPEDEQRKQRVRLPPVTPECDAPSHMHFTVLSLIADVLGPKSHAYEEQPAIKCRDQPNNDCTGQSGDLAIYNPLRNRACSM